MPTQINSQTLRGKMKIPPPLQGPYQRVVLAGQKIMYSAQMTAQIQSLLKQPGDLGAKIGQGIVALMAMLVDQSNHTLPPQLLIPAGMELCTDFADMLRGAGAPVQDSDIGTAIETYVSAVMTQLKVSPQDITAALQGKTPAPSAPPAPTAAPAPAAQPNTGSVATDDEGN